MDNLIICMTVIAGITLLGVAYLTFIKGFPVSFGFCIFFAVFGLMMLFGKFYRDDEQITALSKELPSCRMIEENVDTGSFSENVNKLNCNGVIRNIPVSDYQNAMAVLKDKKSGV